LAHLAMLERGGTWRALTAAWDHGVVAPLQWSADGSALYFTAEERGRRHLWRYALQSGSAGMAAEGGWVHHFDVAGDTVATVADSIEHPARVHVRRPGERALRIERFNDELLAGTRFGASTEVMFAGAAGEQVQMWLVTPPGFDAKKAKKWPVLHNIHGGPHSVSGDTFHYRWNTQLFAAQG